jgi:hypothetical protein
MAAKKPAQRRPNKPSGQGQVVMLEKTAIGINLAGAIVLGLIGFMVTDMRSTMTMLSSKVELALSAITTIQAQGLDARLTVEDGRLRTLEGIAATNATRIVEMCKELERLTTRDRELAEQLKETRKP